MLVGHASQILIKFMTNIQIMACAKDWLKLASRYQLLRKTIYNTDRQTAQLIDEYQIIALTFGYSLSSVKRRYVEGRENQCTTKTTY